LKPLLGKKSAQAAETNGRESQISGRRKEIVKIRISKNVEQLESLIGVGFQGTTESSPDTVS
jgi:hypothetical protein